MHSDHEWVNVMFAGRSACTTTASTSSRVLRTTAGWHSSTQSTFSVTRSSFRNMAVCRFRRTGFSYFYARLYVCLVCLFTQFLPCVDTVGRVTGKSILSRTWLWVGWQERVSCLAPDCGRGDRKGYPVSHLTVGWVTGMGIPSRTWLWAGWQKRVSCLAPDCGLGDWNGYPVSHMTVGWVTGKGILSRTCNLRRFFFGRHSGDRPNPEWSLAK